MKYPCALICVALAGLQVIVAASEFASLTLFDKFVPTNNSWFAPRHPTTNIPTATNGLPISAFAATQTIRFITRNSEHASVRTRSVSTSSSISSSKRNRFMFMPRARHHSPSTRTLLMELSPENRELFSAFSSSSFWTSIHYNNYITEAISITAWMLGLSLMFVGSSSLFMPKPREKRGQQQQQQQQQFAIVTTTTTGVHVNINETNNDLLLTPGTYANSNSAERLVTDTVVARASEAFDSTDFENIPRLSPELEDVEAAFEVALLADAAHAMADAAEKENRQSKAAMLEREKELEWIESHDDGDSNSIGMIGSSGSQERFQRSLLAARLDANSIARAKKRKEAFQRSLLSSRIALDIKMKELVVEQQRKLEAMECDSSSVGVESSALAEADYDDNNHENEVEKDDGEATEVSEPGGRIFLGNDRDSLFEYTQISEEAMQEEKYVDDVGKNDSTLLTIRADSISVQHQWKEGNESIQLETTTDDTVKNENAQLTVQAERISLRDPWRNDSVHAVRKYIHQKAIEKTKKKMMMKNDIDSGTIVSVDNIDTISIANEDESEEIVPKEFNSESNSVEKNFHKRLHIRQMPRRRRLLVVALGLVITRRLFLAYFGNALSMI